MNKYKRILFNYIALVIIVMLADTISNVFYRSGIVFLCCIIFNIVQEYIRYLTGQESDLLNAVGEIRKMKEIDEILVNIVVLLFGPCVQTIVMVGLAMLCS